MWSGIAAELGLLATFGVGSAAMREISRSHCAALSWPTSATGAGAVLPAAAACAAATFAVNFGSPRARRGREHDLDVVAVIRTRERARRARVPHQADDLGGPNPPWSVNSVRIVVSVIVSAPW